MNRNIKAPIRDDRKPLQDLIPVSQPLRVLIDPCDKCNLRCKFCFQSNIDDFDGGVMDKETFNIIVSQLKEFSEPINIIHLYGFGEPLINRDICEYITILKKENIAKEVSITSNGILLTREMSDRLISSGLDKLIISLNGISDDSYFRITGTKVEYERMLGQIQYFAKKKGHCYLHIKINGDDYGGEEKSLFVDTFKEIADSINIDNIVNVWPEINVSENKLSMYGERTVEEKKVCPQMFYEMVIHSDGSISPCCADYKYRDNCLGDVRHVKISEIWNGEQLQNMRVAALKGENIPYKICNGCHYPECAASVDITGYRDMILNKLRL